VTLTRLPVVLMAFAFVGIFGISAGEPRGRQPAQEKDWLLRRQSMGAVCHVQRRDDPDPMGDVLGQYDTRKQACQGALARYEAATDDDGKCGTYGGGTIGACHQDGVNLPQ
jgi:hypothetical protein